MCGIFAYFCRHECITEQQKIVLEALKIQHRGPDETHIIHSNLNGFVLDRFHLVFHRLMINGLSPESGQPLVYPTTGKPTTFLICNGEIYNYRELIEQYDLEGVYDSGSDCEIILHLYHRLGIEETLRQLRGVFAFTLVDLTKKEVYLARDPLGVRSMYYSADSQGVGISSELKSLYNLADPSTIHQFPGGHYARLSSIDGKLHLKRYYTLWDPVHDSILSDNESEVCHEISKRLITAVTRRMMCDRKGKHGSPAVGAYLSGGFDSSIVAAILADHYPGQLQTFSIGFADAPDLLNARTVAQYIGSKHHEYVITEQEALAALSECCPQIESHDVTTNRASLFMYLLSKEVRRVSDVVVMLSGEGADEAFGSYMYFHNAPSESEFHEETIRLLNDLQYFDLLRGDKSSAIAGLEIRVPFLDIDFIDYVKTIPSKMKLCHGVEKYVLRKAMSKDYCRNSEGEQYLPDSILWRRKEAMSDGVSLHSRSWSQVIQEHMCRSRPNGYVQPCMMPVKEPVDLEKDWFRQTFNRHYGGCEGTIPYEWLPKWCGSVKDSSARVLQVYKDKIDQEDSHNAVLSEQTS